MEQYNNNLGVIPTHCKVSMNIEDRRRLDISASFTLENGVPSADLEATVKKIAGQQFLKRLNRANDTGEWYYIGNASRSADRQCVVLGDNDLIQVGAIYKTITVKYMPYLAGVLEHSDIYEDFPTSVLGNIRQFRNLLRKELTAPAVPQKKVKK